MKKVSEVSAKGNGFGKTVLKVQEKSQKGETPGPHWTSWGGKTNLGLETERLIAFVKNSKKKKQRGEIDQERCRTGGWSRHRGKGRDKSILKGYRGSTGKGGKLKEGGRGDDPIQYRWKDIEKLNQQWWGEGGGEAIPFWHGCRPDKKNKKCRKSLQGKKRLD